MFNDQAHEKTFLALCPGKLLNDAEWFSPIYLLTSDSELRRKAAKHINPKKREIEWEEILKTDFGSGHYAIIYWAFTLWAGHSWRWDIENDEPIPPIDTMSKAYSMDENLRWTAITALELRWGFRGISGK